jgi:ADP-heptose:LPS heptosyltransferase
MNPGLSILIRTFNSAGTLQEVLGRLKIQPEDEIIVVDSGSRDATLAIAKKHGARILVAEKPFNYSKSLNVGFAAAINPWVVVLSSHCVPLSEDLLAVFREAIQDFPATVAVAYGDCSLIERPEPSDPIVLFTDKYAEAAQRQRVYGGNGVALYRRTDWQTQPFDETLPTGEDMAWLLSAMENGALAARVPSARVLYRNQGSLRHMFRKGWLESRMMIALTGMPAMNLWQLGINWGSLVKKWCMDKMPASALVRQGAHALGAYLSPKFSGRPRESGSRAKPPSRLKLIFLQLLATRLATYRQGPARLGLDRRQLAHQRIALVKMDGIGDFILATGLLQLIQREFPQAEITLFCRRPVGELVRQQFPGWSVVEIFDLRSTAREILLDNTTRRRLKSQPPFDLLLDLRTFRSFSELTITSWIPARQKVAVKNPLLSSRRSWSEPSEQRIYDQLLPLPTMADASLAQDIQAHLALANWLFPHATATGLVLPKLTVDLLAQAEVAAILKTRFNLSRAKPFLLVCPGTSTSRKEYPVPALAEAILTVMSATPMPVVIAGSNADERTTKPLHRLLQDRCAVMDVTGIFGLTQHLALISLARAVLAMDSCHAHFAGAMSTPAVVILGGGQYGIFGPWGASSTFRWLTHQVPCFGCRWFCIHDRPLCIQDIPSEIIAKNLAEVLSLNRSA